jgi:hypothetical protein
MYSAPASIGVAFGATIEQFGIHPFVAQLPLRLRCSVLRESSGGRSRS